MPPWLNVEPESMGMDHKSPFAWPERRIDNSSTALKPARGTHHGHGLIHDPLTNAKVVIDPALHFLALGDLFGFETGAGEQPTRTRPGSWGCARVNRVSWTGVLYGLLGSFVGTK